MSKEVEKVAFSHGRMVWGTINFSLFDIMELVKWRGSARYPSFTDYGLKTVSA